MAACMVTDEIKKIHIDYNTKMANLQKEKEIAEAKEYECAANIKRQAEEANLAAKAISEEGDREQSFDTSEDDNEPYGRKELNSDTPSSSYERPELTNIRPVEDEPLPIKMKKTSLPSMKRRIQQTRGGNEMVMLLNTMKRDLNALKEDNILIMSRLNALESPEIPTVITSAETSQKGAFLALKNDWVPKILNLLSLIYTEVQNTDGDK